MKDNFWFKDPMILFQKNRLKEFFPIKDMTNIEKLNALVRLSIYLGILLTVITHNYMYLYIIIITGALTIFLYENNKEDFGIMSDFSNKTWPTEDNPFMNYNYITDPREKPKSVTSYNHPKIKDEINTFFNENLYRDVSDLYQKNNSQRQFYSMPCTDIVNDQTKFAKWLYYTDKTCKEDGIKCASYN
tara:strand:+ start:100 stop:663 length:564 start_codon:yes stop_codon:yes gene_type:complete